VHDEELDEMLAAATSPTAQDNDVPDEAMLDAADHSQMLVQTVLPWHCNLR